MSSPERTFTPGDPVILAEIWDDMTRIYGSPTPEQLAELDRRRAIYDLVRKDGRTRRLSDGQLVEGRPR